MSRPNQPIDVWKFVDIPEDGDPNPCWHWEGGTGGKDKDRGYFTIKGVKWLAYRVVYTLIHGEIPDGMMVRHKCDNPICCNPYHLELGSQSENENDKYERDRYGFPKKLVERVIEIAQERSYNNVVIAAIISREFGIKLTAKRVSDIRTGARRAKQSGVT